MGIDQNRGKNPTTENAKIAENPFMADYKKHFLWLFIVLGSLIFLAVGFSQYRKLNDASAYREIRASELRDSGLIISECRKEKQGLYITGRAYSDQRDDRVTPVRVIYKSHVDGKFYRSGRTYITPLVKQIAMADNEVRASNPGVYPFSSSLRTDVTAARGGGQIFVVARVEGNDVVYPSKCFF